MIVLQVIIACMMLLRIFALYEHRAGILVYPIIIAVCAITTAVVGTVKSPSNEMPTIQFHCDSGFTADRAHYIAVAYGGEFLFDLVIFAMTLYKTLTHIRGSGFGLLTMIMRDGTVYFGVMTTANLANILILVLAGPVTCLAMSNPTIIISSITMTRLVLNLRDPKLNGDLDDCKLTPIRFHVPTSPRATGNSSAETCWDEENA